MRARDVMSSPVITLRADTPVRAAAALLVSHGFTSAPVVDAGGVDAREAAALGAEVIGS